MARDPLFWIATTVRSLVKRVDELNAMLVKAGPPGVLLAEALFVFDPNAPEFVPKQCKPEDVPSIPPGVHVRADPPLVFHSALEHAEAVLQELLEQDAANNDAARSKILSAEVFDSEDAPSPDNFILEKAEVCEELVCEVLSAKILSARFLSVDFKSTMTTVATQAFKPLQEELLEKLRGIREELEELEHMKVETREDVDEEWIPNDDDIDEDAYEDKDDDDYFDEAEYAEHGKTEEKGPKDDDVFGIEEMCDDDIDEDAYEDKDEDHSDSDSLFDEGEYAMIKSIMHDRGVFDDARRADEDWLDEQYEKIKTELKSSPKQSHPD